MRGIVLFCVALAASAVAVAQTPTIASPGRQTFVSRCAGCHGTIGNGGELGPAIVSRIPTRTDQDLTALFREGLPSSGMPAFAGLSSAEVTDLIGFLRTLRPPNGTGPARAKVALNGGGTVEGLVLNQSAGDMQLLGDDRKIQLLRKTGDQYRRVTSQADWLSYNGDTSGSRYSSLTEITKGNAASLSPKWIFSLPNTSRLQVTPVVSGGVMYVTAATSATRSTRGAVVRSGITSVRGPKGWSATRPVESTAASASPATACSW